MKKQLKAKLELAKFLQGTVEEMAVKLKQKGETPDTTADHLQEFIKKVSVRARVFRCLYKQTNLCERGCLDVEVFI